MIIRREWSEPEIGRSWPLPYMTSIHLTGDWRGLHRVVMPEPLAEQPREMVSFVDSESLRTFAEKLRRELRKRAEKKGKE